MVDTVRDQLAFHNYHQQAWEAIIDMCEELSRALSTTCEIDEPDAERIAREDGVNQ